MINESDPINEKQTDDYPLPIIEEEKVPIVPIHISKRIQSIIDQNDHYNNTIKYTSHTISFGTILNTLLMDNNSTVYMIMEVNFLIWYFYTLFSESFIQTLMNKFKLQNYNELVTEPEHSKDAYCSECCYNMKKCCKEKIKDPYMYILLFYIFCYTVTILTLSILYEETNIKKILVINTYMIINFIQYVASTCSKIREFNYQYV